MSGSDDEVLDSTMASCGTCKRKIAAGEQTASCGNCNRRFHKQCVGGDLEMQNGRWFCAKEICQIASLIEEEKLSALEGKIKNLEAAQKADLLLKQKEKKMIRALEKRKKEEEEKMRAQEEEEEAAVQEQILQAKLQELERKETRRKSFDEKMADLDKKLKDLTIVTESSDRAGGNGSKDGLGQQSSGPTKAQLAARNGLTQKLPSFSGKPEEWPLFYGAFQASNAACGYSDVENLVRLQECLTGLAFEMVSGQLILPKSVPKVIAKLRMLFGRPEQLLQAHLDKVRNLQPPSSDKLASFIPFGNAIEQMCEHIEAADLNQHLINPLLIQDLVDKLPDPEKRPWVRFKKRFNTITLRTFTDFIMEIVEEACEANVTFDFISYERFGGEAKERAGAELRRDEDEFEDDAGDKRRLAPCKLSRSTEHRLRDCGNFKKLKYAERLDLVTREQLCTRCLNEHGNQCWFKFRCNVGDCRESHHSLMHPVETIVGVNAHICSDNDVTFRMIPVQLHSGGRPHEVLAFLDEGSSVTLIDQKLADQLELDGVPEQLTIKLAAGYQRTEDSSRRMNLHVSAVGDGDDEVELRAVRTVEKLTLPRQQVDSDELCRRYRHLRGLPIESYNGRPQMLIGLNNFHTFAPSEVRTGAATEPVAVRCKLGWAVYGQKQENLAGEATKATHQRKTDDLDEVRANVEKFKKNTKKPKRKPKKNGYRGGLEVKESLEVNDLRSPGNGAMAEGAGLRMDHQDDQGEEARKCRCCRLGSLVKSGFRSQIPDVTGWGVATHHAISVASASGQSPARADCHSPNRADANKEEDEVKTKRKQKSCGRKI